MAARSPYPRRRDARTGSQKTVGGPWTPPDQILHSSIAALLSVGRTPSAQEIDDFFDIWGTLNPWPDVVRSLYALHSHFTLAILSNMSVATQSSLMEHAGLPFDHTLSAEAVRAYKPNPAVYEMAITRLGLKPDEIMMVAAHKYDLTAAKGQGLQTAFVARPLELGPNGNVDTTPNPAYDLNVTSFTELAQKLGAGPPQRFKRTASVSIRVRFKCNRSWAVGRSSMELTKCWTLGQARTTPAGRRTLSRTTGLTACASWVARMLP